MTRRFVSIRLPHWTADRARRSGPQTRPEGRDADGDPPRVFTLSGSGGVRLHAVCARARALGLAPGMTLSDARAAAPDLAAADADPAGDAAALADLARWCGRWTPWSAARPAHPGADAVLLETTGCERVHGGEAALLADIAGRFAALGVEPRIAAAPTIGLAWGLAASAHSGPVAVAGAAARDALTRLPVRALRIEAETAGALEALGLRRAGDLLTLRRADLARRFGLQLVRRLDQARGAEAEVLDPVLPAARLRARRRYAEPLTGADQIVRAAGEAAADLCALLEREGLGARRAGLTLYRVDGRAFEIACGTSAPARDADHLAGLLADKIERAEIDAGFGIEIVEAAALTAEPMQAAQNEMGESRTGADPDRLTDRLSARLGEAAVLRPEARQSHVPERAAIWAPGGDGMGVRPDARRPLLMLETPEPVEAVAQMPDGPPRLFVWRRLRHRVARAEGPERVAPEWWRGEGAARRTRDYFRVETECGRRFMLYRDGLAGRHGDWGSGEAQQSRWFVCGAE